MGNAKQSKEALEKWTAAEAKGTAGEAITDTLRDAVAQELKDGKVTMVRIKSRNEIYRFVDGQGNRWFLKIPPAADAEYANTAELTGAVLARELGFDVPAVRSVDFGLLKVINDMSIDKRELIAAKGLLMRDVVRTSLPPSPSWLP